MNRHERRTRGKWIAERLRTLKSSPLLDRIDLKSLPEETVKSLIEGTCEDKALQKTYNTTKKIMDEIMSLDIELYNMQTDLAQKKGLKTS